MRPPFSPARLFTMPLAAWAIFGVAISALTFVFIMQYGFGYEPCVLCQWQRLPYVIAAIAAFLALIWQPYKTQTTAILGICVLAFATGAALALFHSGVERHWWLGTSGCAIQPLNGGSIEDLRTQLTHMAVARCDQISWTFLGLTMANWNIPFSLGLTGFAASTAWRQHKQTGKLP